MLFDHQRKITAAVIADLREQLFYHQSHHAHFKAKAEQLAAVLEGRRA